MDSRHLYIKVHNLVFHYRTTVGTGFLADVCEAWEREALKGPTRNVCMRFSVILSEKGGVVAKLLPLFGLGAGGNFGSGKQAFSWIRFGGHCSIAFHSLPFASPVLMLLSSAASTTRQLLSFLLWKIRVCQDP